MEQESKLCANNCGFFGSSTTNNLCSKCYKGSFLPKNISSLDPKSEVEENSTTAAGPCPCPSTSAAENNNPPASAAAAAANRCGFCKKKVGLMGFQCKCGGVFCSMHRYSDKHGCGFDYRSEGKDAIEKANPIIKPEKVEKI